MKFQAFLLSILFTLAGTDAVFAQEGNEAEAEAPAAAAAEAPAESPDEAEAAPAVAADESIDVDAVIAKFNEGSSAPRTFTSEEREWIAAGLDPGQVDNAHKGYVAIPSGDPNLVIINRHGKRIEVRSNPAVRTPPSMAEEWMIPFSPEVDEGTIWLPVAASQTARDVDAMFNFIMWISYFFSALIGILMIVFCIKYRRRPGVKADQSLTHNTPVEIVWSVIPAILCAIMFWGGYVTFLDLRTPPPDAMQINVAATRWNWTFTYANGVENMAEFHVPENTPIEMVMTSNDVLHSFHLPAYRVKSDVLPNRYTKVWFDSGAPGMYRVYCAEYCGMEHSNMYAKLVVESQEDYEAWLTKVGNWMVDENGELLPPLEIGELTYTKKGCNSCHSIDGSKGLGPTFGGLWGFERTFENVSETVIADENYIAESVREPYAKIVTGYGKQMTLFTLADEQVTGIIAFIKSLKDVKRLN